MLLIFPTAIAERSRAVVVQLCACGWGCQPIVWLASWQQCRATCYNIWGRHLSCQWRQALPSCTGVMCVAYWLLVEQFCLPYMRSMHDYGFVDPEQVCVRMFIGMSACTSLYHQSSSACSCVAKASYYSVVVAPSFVQSLAPRWACWIANQARCCAQACKSPHFRSSQAQPHILPKDSYTC